MGLNPPRNAPARPPRLQLFLLVFVTAASFALLAFPLALRPAALSLQAGEVAPRDLQAPEQIEYVSTLRTEEARRSAELAVEPVYGLSDPSIARKQIERLRAALQYITLVRTDPNSTLEQKQSDLASLSDLQLNPQAIESILALPPAHWDSIQQESLSVLEQVMRNTIREDGLDTAIRNIPSLVSLALNEEQVALVAELVTAFVIPNSLYSPELTGAARQAARDSIEPIVQRYQAGEIIVPRGQVITPADMEALQQLGLIEPRRQLQDYLGIAAVCVMMASFLGLYFSRRRLVFLTSNRNLIVLALIFLLFLAGARITIPNRTVLPYAFPLPGLGLLISTLFGMEAGIIFSLAISPLASYGLSNTLDLTPYYLFASLCGVLVLGNARRVWAFYRGGMAIAGTGIAILLAYRVPFTDTDGIGLLTLTAAAIFNGVASASLALLLQYFIAQSIGLTTALQLLEISRPDFPLLQLFLRNAPGTYQHSLQVANLAEQAAERIGADSLLTRVGALFHDIGKAANPAFFIENQLPGSLNTHDDLVPAEAAAFVIRHVTDGVLLARKHRLPKRIEDFILEHHGTFITRYQYNKALQAAGGDASKVDMEKFRYPGPPPRSRETALLMLADGAEARGRAQRPKDDAELEAIIRDVIDQAQRQGQLDDTRLTQRDLHLIMEAFVETLRGTYHPRIQYPSEAVPVSADIRTVPAKKI